MTLNYRDYQETLDREINHGWNSGLRNMAAQSPTGSGKTVLFCGITQRRNVNTVAIAHRRELVSQMSMTYARNGIEHSVVGSTSLIRDINKIHLAELGRTFYRSRAKVKVASIDTLIGAKQYALAKDWGREVGLWIMDEGHHLLKDNKWGKGIDLFPNAVGLGVSAWFGRTDGKGLGSCSDGYYDELIYGLEPKELIERGYLTPFKLYGRPSDINTVGVDVSQKTGDFNQRKLTQRAKESRIVGDVVEHYLKIAPGKLGVTFVTDSETGAEVVAKFNANGVPAAFISAKTPDLERAKLLAKFKNRELLQLVNIDIFGEGFDCPAIEVVSFARPTASYSLYIQQFGRALRILEGKDYAIIIDHVGNIVRHGGPPLTMKPSTLERRDKVSIKEKDENEIKLKRCHWCLAEYEAFRHQCPMCGYEYKPQERSKPEFVEGDLVLLESFAVDELNTQVEESRKPPNDSGNSQYNASNQRKYAEKIAVKDQLDEAIAQWAGEKKAQGICKRDRYRLFYRTFGVDVLTARALNTKDSQALLEKVLGIESKPDEQKVAEYIEGKTEVYVSNVMRDTGVAFPGKTLKKLGWSVRQVRRNGKKELLYYTVSDEQKVIEYVEGKTEVCSSDIKRDTGVMHPGNTLKKLGWSVRGMKRNGKDEQLYYTGKSKEQKVTEYVEGKTEVYVSNVIRDTGVEQSGRILKKLGWSVRQVQRNGKGEQLYENRNI